MVDAVDTDDVETGHGSIFELANDADVLTQIGQPLNVPIPNAEASELINTSHMQTQDFHDFIQAPLREGVESDVDMNWVPGSATEELCNKAVGKKRRYRIVVPAAAGPRQFTGLLLVRNYVRDNPMLEGRKGTLTVKWLTKPVEAAAL